MGYPSDLTTKQWNKIKHFFEKENRGKHFRTQNKRKLVNAVLYLNKTGCQWRQMPKDFPKWSTVRSFYQRAVKSGLWEKIRSAIVEETRVKAGRKAEPSYGLIDSKSVPTTSECDEVGFDGGKKVKGRKRHIVTDIMGNLLTVVVHAANIHDAVGGVEVMKSAFKKYPSLKGVCADDAYRKSFKETIEAMGLTVDISERIKPEWEILPKRWRVERSFAWMNGSRRLSKDYEINTISAENMTIISHISTLFKRF